MIAYCIAQGTQLCGDLNGKEIFLKGGGGDICICIVDSVCYIWQKLTHT